jgi:flagellar protein FliO/FliZ
MEVIDIARIFFALIAVLGMIGLAAIAAKRFGLQNGAAAFGRERRLALVETFAIDQRRRAAIIACDGREHLIILDQARVTVVERAIPARETQEAADPIAARASVSPFRKLQVPAAVMNLIHRAPRDRTMALRAAGII